MTLTIFLPKAAFMSVDFPTSVSPQTTILGCRISFLAAISLWIFQKSCLVFGIEKLTWERKASQYGIEFTILAMLATVSSRRKRDGWMNVPVGAR